MTRSLVASLGFVAAVAAGATTADAKQVRYVGLHPIPEKVGGGLCYLEAPHVHVYAPSKPEVLYRVHDGDYFFVGDPVAYGYDGPRHNYYGHHPVDIDVVVGDASPTDDDEFCYLDGPHFHGYAPPPGASFTVKAEANWYVGPFPAHYRTHKKRYATINAVYAPMVYVRPVVEVDAPPVGYVGPLVEVHAPVVEVVAPVVAVEGPEVRAGIEVHIPVPTLEIGFGFGGVVVDDHHHVHSARCGHDHGHDRGRGYKKAKHHGKRGRGGWVRRRDHR